MGHTEKANILSAIVALEPEEQIEFARMFNQYKFPDTMARVTQTHRTIAAGHTLECLKRAALSVRCREE